MANEIERIEFLIRDRITKVIIPYYIAAVSVNLGDENNYISLPDRLEQMAQAIRDASSSYSPPTGGFPADQLSAEVQALLTLAGTAVQNVDSELDASSSNPVENSVVATAIAGLQRAVDLLTNTEDASNIINSMVEVTNFLAGITNDQTLAGKLYDLQQQIDAKQAAIADLETIRSGADKGATSVQKVKVGAGGTPIDPVNGTVTIPDIPTKTSDLDNDERFLKEGDMKTINGSSVVGNGNISIPSGDDGKSAYEIAVDNGFEGSEAEWLASLKGQQGNQGNVQVDGDGNVLIVNNLTDGGGGAALSAEMGKHLANISYLNSSPSGTVTNEYHRPITHYGCSFVRGQRQVQTSGGRTFSQIQDNSSQANRITTSTVFVSSDFGATVKVFVPAGFYMMIRQANSLTDSNPTTAGYLNGDNDGVNVMVDGGENGTLHTFSLVRTYWAFWAKYGSNNAAITDQMIEDLTDGCYIVENVTEDVSEPVVEIIGTNGVVRNVYSEAGGTKCQIYTKDKVDALLADVKPAIRVLQYNIGHFSRGYTNGSSITSTNYDEMLARWKSMIKNVDADIMGLPEYNTIFGNNGSGYVSTVNSGIFDGYNLSVGASAAGGWWMNTLASRLNMTGDADKDLGSTGGENAYARYATVNIEGKSVLIAVTHLNWARTSAHVASRTVEIQNLIKWLAKYEYVILMGDFNTDGSVVQSAAKTEADFMAGVSEFDPFKYYNFDEVVDGVTKHYEGGFVLANHGWFGDFKTCDATGSRPDHLTDSARGNGNPDTFYNRPFCCLDNIIVKGFRMSNVQVIDDGVLTDHCGILCDLTLIDSD